ncbi:MAG TPA: hypothetical protein VHE35_27955 [Kofleriaceae bacterium]|nr:hypothetical protein [Kofleriaceae bacterium]
MARPDLTSFLERFVRPLVAGGDVHVGKPLTADDVQRFEDELPHATLAAEQVDDARADVLSLLVARPPPMVLGPDELALAAALHDALVLAHPDADGTLVTDRMRKKIAATALALASQPPTRDRSRVLARHALLHHLFDLGRDDLMVSWWTGHARFLGQKAPARLTTWRTVRRVREEVTRAGFDELLASPEVAPVTAALVRRTPLTQLLSSHPAAPPLHWEDAAFLLRDAELARAIAYHVVGSAEPRVELAAPSRLAAALEPMLERNPPAADVRVVVAFLVHLAGLVAMAESLVTEPAAKSPVLTAALGGGAGQRPRGLVTFCALPDALAQCAPALAQPPGLDGDPVWLRRWQAHRAQVQELVGAPLIHSLAERLARHLGGPVLTIEAELPPEGATPEAPPVA